MERPVYFKEWCCLIVSELQNYSFVVNSTCSSTLTDSIQIMFFPSKQETDYRDQAFTAIKTTDHNPESIYLVLEVDKIKLQVFIAASFNKSKPKAQ